METYHFETEISEKGIIVLPDAMRTLVRHKVRLTISNPEKTASDAGNVLSETADEHSQPDEDDRLLGLFSDEPELMDEIAESAMKSRENDLLR